MVRLMCSNFELLDPRHELARSLRGYRNKHNLSNVVVGGVVWERTARDGLGEGRSNAGEAAKCHRAPAPKTAMPGAIY